jgi:NAD(P)-dependent dehydrogenase (short-subunit alcohol dehydrogenase family)
MLLKDKVAVVYGARGAIGGAAARAFADEGAQVFGADVDALDEQAVAEHLQQVVEEAGHVDVSFNAIGLPDAEIVGQPLESTDVERFARPIAAYTTSYFLTARLAARHMRARGSGVILTVSALPARVGSQLNGGYGPAVAAKEALTRDLSAELAPHGIRVVCLRPHGLPESDTMREVFAAKDMGLTWDQFTGYLANTSHPKRTQTLTEVGSAAAWLASDRASGLTGTTVNLTMGATPD